MERLSLGVLVSGRGSNLQALIDACADPAFPARIACVLSNKVNAPALDRAERAGIPTRVIRPQDHADKAAFELTMTRALEEAGVRLVCLAGFMRLLSPVFVERWHDRLINIHPSLLPAFPGLDTHVRALAEGVRFHGCTVHYVRAAMDRGPILIQAAVPVLTDDTPDTLAARVLAQEHRCYPLAVRLIAEGRVSVLDEKVLVRDSPPAPAALLHPAG